MQKPQIEFSDMDAMDNINAKLRDAGAAFRVSSYHVGSLAMNADFIAFVGEAAGCQVLIDGELNRYLRDANGIFYECTNKDLTGKNPIDRALFIETLSGLYN